MKNFIGKELSLGDRVGVVLCSGTRVANLYSGEIVGFVNRAGYECASVKLDNDKKFWWRDYPVNKSSRKIVKL